MGDIFTGGNIPRRITPLRIQSVGGGGGSDSFTTSPVRLLDQQLVFVGGVPTDAGWRFLSTGDMQYHQPPNSLVAVPDQPQWHEGSGGSFSHRNVGVNPEGTANPFWDFPVLNTWYAMQGKTYQWDRPPAGTSVWGETIVQIAASSDLDTILAQAVIRFTYDRP